MVESTEPAPASREDREVSRLLGDSSTLLAPGGGVDAAQSHWESINSPDPTQRASGERTRRKLQFFFMNPIDKWRARRRPPYKLAVQLVKVVLVTVQLCLFANHRYSHVTYVANSVTVLEHLLLEGWETSREVNVYPPAAGPLAVYSRQRFLHTIDYAVNAYYNISGLAISGVDYPAETGPDCRLCVLEYRQVHVDPAHQSFSLDTRTRTRCVHVSLDAATRANHNFSVQQFAREHNFSLGLIGVIRTELSFSLNTVKLKVAMPLDVPDCYRFNATLLLDNANQDGQILVSLGLAARSIACDIDARFLDENNEIAVLFTAMNVLIVLMCVVSLAMCIRSIYRGQMLRRETSAVLRRYFNYRLSDEESARFLNLWYILIIVNDVLIVLGSLVQVQLENRATGHAISSDTWNVCSLFLGIGDLLAWVGVLRYFGFFKSYNVLILTVKKSMPSVLRFSVCAAICYGGFVFCGWLVFSPYNVKFRTISSTSETLFSLMNGDDMFATFAQVSTKSALIFWFSKIYIYVFVFFFIYLVLSLMISIIMDAYETIKMFYREGFPRSPLDEFVAARRLDPSSGVYREEQDERLFFRLLSMFFNCSWANRSEQVTRVDATRQQRETSERSPLLATVG